MIIKQISVFIENKRGRLAEITKVLQDNAIDIRALCIADTKDFGILRIIVDDPDKAVEVLKEDGFTVSLTKVIGIGIDDVPGGLHKAMAELYAEKISVEYMYAFVSRCDKTAYVILRVEDNEKAIEVLTSKGFTVMNSTKI